MTYNSSKRDILEVVIGILLMLPLMFGVSWGIMAAIDSLHDRDALLAHQASGHIQAEPPQSSSSDFSALSRSKADRGRLLRELEEAK